VNIAMVQARSAKLGQRFVVDALASGEVARNVKAIAVRMRTFRA